MKPSTSLSTLSFAVSLVALLGLGCEADTQNPAGGPITGNDGGVLPPAGDAGATPPPTDGRNPPAPPDMTGSACSLGAGQPCDCQTQTGQTVHGTQLCTPDGVWGECACSERWPWLGPTCSNGAEECAPLVSDLTDFAGRHCCTNQQSVTDNQASAVGKCGVMNDTAFGSKGGFLGIGGSPVCIQRNFYPPVTQTHGCAETVIPFLQLKDCCRPDNKCGLTLDYPNYEDLGCIEKTEMANIMKNSGLLTFFLCFVNGACDALDNLAKSPGTCTYGAAAE